MVCLFLTATETHRLVVLGFLKWKEKIYFLEIKNINCQLLKITVGGQKLFHLFLFIFFNSDNACQKTHAASKIKSPKELQQRRANKTPCVQGVVKKDCLLLSRSCM